MTLGYPNKFSGATNFQMLVYNRLIEYDLLIIIFKFIFYDRWFYVIINLQKDLNMLRTGKFSEKREKYRPYMGFQGPLLLIF